KAWAMTRRWLTLATMSDDTGKKRPGRRIALDPAKLRAARERQVLSQAELARRSGISRQMINALENDRIGASAAMLRRLAAELDVAPSSLLADPADPAGADDLGGAA